MDPLEAKAPLAKLPTIAIVIPAYRAAAHIRSVLAGIPSFVDLIVVVDDASPDDTADCVKTWNDSRVHLIRHSQNQGVGEAVLTGYAAAIDLGAEIVVKMDSDGQMDADYMLPLIVPILQGEADYTKGNRFLHARQLRAMPAIRRIGNLGLSFLTKLASGYWNIFDPTNGYTAIHPSIISQLDQSAIHRRYFFETSMLLELGLVRAVVRDVYIPARVWRRGEFLIGGQSAFGISTPIAQGAHAETFGTVISARFWYLYGFLLERHNLYSLRSHLWRVLLDTRRSTRRCHSDWDGDGGSIADNLGNSVPAASHSFRCAKRACASLAS